MNSQGGSLPLPKTKKTQEQLNKEWEKIFEKQNAESGGKVNK